MATSSQYFSASAKKSVAAFSHLRNLRTRGNEKRKVKIELDEDSVGKKKKDDTCSSGVSARQNDHKDQVLIAPHQQDKNLWEPDGWKIVLSNIKEMRKDKTAVVDAQGCERTADMSEKPEVVRYQVLVSLMLSSQTKDQMTFAAMGRLKEFGLTIPNIMKASEKEIGKLIYPVGFWQRKAKFILQTTHICHEKYNDDIPKTIKDLVSLPGVGEKMAYICMSAAWGLVEGIGVDTHVHRIANWLKWVKKPTKTPEKTRKELEAWLPRSEWGDLNILLVGFGQQTCLSRNPRCKDCLNKSICPASKWEAKPTSSK